jgi:hypothetical protein
MKRMKVRNVTQGESTLLPATETHRQTERDASKDRLNQIIGRASDLDHQRKAPE